MKKIFYLIALLLMNMSWAQFQFSDLKYIDIEDSFVNGTFGYKSTLNFQLINKACGQINACLAHSEPTTLIGKLTLAKDKVIEFHYTEVPSQDPRFIAVYNNESVFVAAGTRLHLKGEVLYVEGNANAFFDKRRKFEWKNNSYQEVKQPFYAINEIGKLNYAITIYEDKACTQKVALLPKGYAIEIVLGITGGEYDDLQKVLIKSKFGLLGWFNFEEAIVDPPLIDGFYFNGD